MLTKMFAFADTETEQLAKLMTSKVRRHVKPGSAQLIPQGKLSA